MKTTFPITAFNPPFYLKNPHLQSILPKFVRQPKPRYKREYHLDSTGLATVAYDFVINDKSSDTLFVMFHGLEGSSQSHYALSFANRAIFLNKNAVIVHYRGCGGLANASPVDYNAGDTGEAHYVLSRLAKLYPKLHVVGVSLGGNLLARYLGEYGEQAVCVSAVVVSAPVDLASSAEAMHRLVARHVYTPYLLKSLIKKASTKLEGVELERLNKIKFIDEFDEFYTAPRHGYGTRQNYYRQASALPVLKDIVCPTLIISSQDDPFLGIVASQSDVSDSVQLYYPKHGGHTGFLGVSGRKFDLGWLSKTAFEFFEFTKV